MKLAILGATGGIGLELIGQSTEQGHSVTAVVRNPERLRKFGNRISTAFLFQDAILPPAALVGRLFFHDVVVDEAAMEAVIRQSGLDWTPVRPPRLTDKPQHGQLSSSRRPSSGVRL